jgi:hypothetical protein
MLDLQLPSEPCLPDVNCLDSRHESLSGASSEAANPCQDTGVAV